MHFEVHIYKGHPAFFETKEAPYVPYENVETYIETSFDYMTYGMAKEEKLFIEGFNHFVDYLLSDGDEYFLQEAKKAFAHTYTKMEESKYMLGLIRILEGNLRDAGRFFKEINDFGFPRFIQYYRVPTLVVKTEKGKAQYFTPSREGIEKILRLLQNEGNLS
ncbi:MAG TPA: hypothetical protein EYH48_00360 [Aquifex aeolicus]|uniref:Uncharacterized protein n=1 Tax=Aquifex aeolicus TaxID=63363 RepID=A0A9D0YPR1_AQUAO|nr:hypothetical protein [Aquificales bacterium]HIP86785.1 hypothetical protein [Aquifex sp.]HIP98820.1 hypothetical protein [Aquifex aeolicus]HIQ25775.1 hypothetical protein [Aquifex aeolicus]